MDDRDAYLDRVLLGGREPVTRIVLVEHDPAWADRFAALRTAVTGALGPAALDVQHIGSTSVPGLVAKPIVDVLVTVADVSNEPGYVPALEQAGLVLRVREPDHRMLRTPQRDAHLHVYEAGHPAVAAYLDLRDWLRTDRAARDLYAATKLRLAQRSWKDMNDYADAKSEVIAQLLAQARSS